MTVKILKCLPLDLLSNRTRDSAFKMFHGMSEAVPCLRHADSRSNEVADFYNFMKLGSFSLLP